MLIGELVEGKLQFLLVCIDKFWPRSGWEGIDELRESRYLRLSLE